MRGNLLIIAFLLAHLFCNGQTIKYDVNAPHNDDVVTKIQLEYFPSPNDGRNILWDFSNLSMTDKQEQTTYFYDADSVLCSMDDHLVYKYQLSKDTLKLIGYETRLEQMNYPKPLTVIVYPFSFGDKTTCYYEGVGTYCQKLTTKSTGTQIVEASADGEIITATEDTLKNVIKLHTIRSSSIGMYHSEDTLFSDSSYIKQEIKDINQWYAPGYRYPLYETISTAYYDHLNLVSTIKSAYMYRIKDQEIKDDKEKNETNKKEEQTNKDIFHYKISFENNELILSFSLDENANVNTLICNVRGMLYLHKSTNELKGTGYQISYDIASLPKGVYILYINANGQIYNEKFNKQ